MSKMVEVDDYYIDSDRYIAAWENRGSTSILNDAIDYASRKWEVFPAHSSGAKKSHKSAEHSNGRNWGKTTDPHEIRRDFQQWIDANIGIATGPKSNIFVVEADTKEGHDEDGLAALKELEEEYGPLPPTLQAESPSGSRHYYFKWPSQGNVYNSASQIAPGVDVRGEGGMVIAPPSLRPGKGYYRWLNAGTPVADAPDWLLTLIASVGRRPENDPLPEWLQEIIKGDCGKGTSADANDLPPRPDVAKVKAMLDVIPNPDLRWGERDPILMAIWAATGGTPAGFDLADAWARKAPNKYDAIKVRSRWDNFCKYPPTHITVGTLFHHADRSDPGWRDRYWQSREARLLQSSAEFVAGFVPPDYLIDGLLQRRFIYSFTGPTGSGKTSIALLMAASTALGVDLAGKHVEKGRVLYFAGENPDDVRTRWIKECEELKQSPDVMDVIFLPGTPPISNDAIRKRIDVEAAQYGPFNLLIVDTSAAYFRGDDENSNAQLAAHARMLRSFVNIPGGPTILVTCHPVKNFDIDNLLPRGGGAFLNEVDGNLVCMKNDSVATVHWHGKFRGPDFAPITFKLNPGTSEKIKDSKGTPIWTVTAAPISEGEKTIMENTGRRRQDELLILIQGNPGLTLAEMATKLGWMNSKGEPNRTLVNRTLSSLMADKLVKRDRGRIVLTKEGQKASKDADLM